MDEVDGGGAAMREESDSWLVDGGGWSNCDLCSALCAYVLPRKKKDTRLRLGRKKNVNLCGWGISLKTKHKNFFLEIVHSLHQKFKFYIFNAKVIF
jgi:hypothetical protein